MTCPEIQQAINDQNIVIELIEQQLGEEEMIRMDLMMLYAMQCSMAAYPVPIDRPDIQAAWEQAQAAAALPGAKELLDARLARRKAAGTQAGAMLDGVDQPAEPEEPLIP